MKLQRWFGILKPTFFHHFDIFSSQQLIFIGWWHWQLFEFLFLNKAFALFYRAGIRLLFFGLAGHGFLLDYRSLDF